MNDLTISGGNAGPLTMSSLEIADLVDSRHDKVKQSIERLAERGVISLPPMGGVKIQRERRAETVQVYNLCKRDSLVVVAQLCPEFTARIVDRWQALEEQAAKPALNPANLSRLQLIELAMQAEQERLVLEHKVGELEPKAEALDRLATANGSFCIRDAAKTLQVQEKWLKQFMREHEWIYQRPMGHGWLAYADKLKQGVMEHKTTTGEKSDGSEWVDTQARITAKGMAKLSTLIQEHGQPRLAA